MSKENELKPFEEIYLQSEDDSFDWLDGTTWCQDRVNETDVKYIHSDVVDKLKKELEEAICIIKGLLNFPFQESMNKAKNFLSKHEREG